MYDAQEIQPKGRTIPLAEEVAGREANADGSEFETTVGVIRRAALCQRLFGKTKMTSNLVLETLHLPDEAPVKLRVFTHLTRHE